MAERFNAWSYTRRAMGYGAAIESDTQRAERGYEEHSAIMDARAAELAKEIEAELDDMRKLLQRWYETDCPDMTCGTDGWTCELCTATKAMLGIEDEQPAKASVET